MKNIREIRRIWVIRDEPVARPSGQDRQGMDSKDKAVYTAPVAISLTPAMHAPGDCDTGMKASGDCANGDVPWDCVSGNMV